MNKKKLIINGVIIIVIALSGYVLYDTFKTNNRAKEIYSSAHTGARPAANGRDETPIKPSAIESYKVEASKPRVLTIDKLNVRARIMHMGVNAQSEVDTPNNIFDSAWYSSSAVPGTPGQSLITAHFGGPTQPGLFATLSTLSKGDTITIERGDGSKLSYKVSEVTTINAKDVNMGQVLSTHNAKEGLSLMTCSGVYDAKKDTYDKRTIVYATKL